MSNKPKAKRASNTKQQPQQQQANYIYEKNTMTCTKQELNTIVAVVEEVLDFTTTKVGENVLETKSYREAKNVTEVFRNIAKNYAEIENNEDRVVNEDELLSMFENSRRLLVATRQAIIQGGNVLAELATQEHLAALDLAAILQNIHTNNIQNGIATKV